MRGYRDIRAAMQDKNRAGGIPHEARALLDQVAQYRLEHDLL